MNIQKITKAFLFICVAVLVLSHASQALAQSFSFSAAGDYANGSNFQANVAQVKANNPAFNLVLGDMAYSTAEQSWCNTWTANFNKVVIVSGNHDSGESSAGNINNYIQYCPFTLGVPVTGTYGKQYYFDYPATSPIARFIMIVPGLGGSFVGLNTNYSAGSPGYNFTSAAIDDARSRGIKWIVVGMHKNYISAMEKGNELGSDLVPMLINKKVDLILQGHEHGYERSHQLSCARVNTFDATCIADNDSNFNKGAGTIIDVVGTGGQGLRSLNTRDSEYPYFASTDVTTYGFGKFTVTPTQITYNFVRAAGGSFTDSFVITDNGVNPTPTVPPVTASPTQSPTAPATPTVSPSPSPTPTRSPLPTTTPTVSPVPTITASPVASGCATVPMTLGVLTYNVSVGSSGTYFFWTRMMSLSDSANSLYMQMDTNCAVVIGDLNGSPSNSWQWINYQDGNALKPTALTLSAGSHTLKIIGKEAGVKVDKVLFIGSNCVPALFGDNCFSTATAQPSIVPTVTASATPVATQSPTPTPSASVVPSASPTASPVPTPTSTPGTSTGVIHVIEDASVNQSNDDYNYGARTVLEVDGSPQRRMVYLKFDAAAFSGNISSAILKLKIENGSDSQYFVREVSSNNWNQRTLTYNNRPSVGSVIAQFNGGDEGSTTSIDITSFVRTKLGREFSIEIDTKSDDGLNFYSMETSKKPIIQIR
jgi:hypothetical protein